MISRAKPHPKRTYAAVMYLAADVDFDGPPPPMVAPPTPPSCQTQKIKGPPLTGRTQQVVGLASREHR